VSKLTRVKVRRGSPKSSLAVRFDPADLEKFRARAEVEGLALRSWSVAGSWNA
jgi:hypothetical protein